MAVLTMSHANSVDVRAMDDQHGILMDALNELRLAVVRGADREEIIELLNRLIHFTRMHFWSEEQLMEQTHYPLLEEHRNAHHRLITELTQRARSIQFGESAQTNHLMSSLRTVYIDHMEQVDRLYGPYLNDLGIY